MGRKMDIYLPALFDLAHKQGLERSLTDVLNDELGTDVTEVNFRMREDSRVLGIKLAVNGADEETFGSLARKLDCAAKHYLDSIEYGWPVQVDAA